LTTLITRPGSRSVYKRRRMCTCMQVRNRTCVVCVSGRSVSRRTSSHTVANIPATCRFRAISAAPRPRTPRPVQSASRLRPTYDVTSSLFTVLELLLHDVFAPRRPKSPDSCDFLPFAFCLSVLSDLVQNLLPGAVALLHQGHPMCTVCT